MRAPKRIIVPTLEEVAKSALKKRLQQAINDVVKNARGKRGRELAALVAPNRIKRTVKRNPKHKGK